MEWIILLIIGTVLLLFPNVFAKIGWFNFNNLKGNESTWEKEDKKNAITNKVLFVYRIIGSIITVCSLIKLFVISD